MAEQAEPAPSSGLPARAQAFLIATGVAAAAVTVPALVRGHDLRPFWTFLVITAAASVTQLFAFHTIRNQVFHTTPLLLVAAALLLPPPLLLLVPLLSHIPDWIRKRYAWYIQTFNVLNFTLAVMSAWLVRSFVADAVAGRGAAWAVSAGAAAATFVVVNNLGFAIILRLARGHTVREILNPQTLSADTALACLGVALADFWRADPWLVPFALTPIFLLQAALHIPQLAEEARIDAKTYLANARHFREALAVELSRARRFGRPLSVIVADLDLLRNINNTYGHLAGDAVLTGIADILRRHVRDYDVAARFGGEEFAIVLPETSLREAWRIAERIREATATTPIWAESVRQHVTVTLSLGVASFPAHGSDPDDLLHHADVAAYHAKLRGRNRVQRASRRAMLTAVASEPLIHLAIADEPATPAVRVETAASSGPRLLARTAGVVGVLTGLLALAGGVTHDLRGLLVMAGLVAIGQALALEVDHGTISAGAVAALAGVAIFGVQAALVLAVVGVAVDVAVRRWPPDYALLSLGVRSLALLLAGAIFALSLRAVPDEVLTPVLGPIAGAASFTVISGLISLAPALAGRASVWQVWRESFAWLLPHYAVYGFVAAVTAVAYRAVGLYALAAFAVSLLAIRKTQEAVVRQARRNAENLRDAADIIQTQNVSLQRVNQLLKQRSTSAMESLSGIVDMRDAYTAGHSRRVRDLALAMGRDLGLSPAELDVLGWAALFHDIGKLAVPEAILLKPDVLTDDEWEVVRRHPDEGASIIDRLGFLAEAVPAIRHHHERIDGTGYPARLAGERIPLEARIIHVADAYDSMRTNRVYRAARSSPEALDELNRAAGKQFCEHCVIALERVLASGSFAGEGASRAPATSATRTAG
jgi:diguanylate cyclase (GGDEF)-like protein/putative nucleotidyltransferase with HDIG domain